MEPNLFTICVTAFLAVFVLLATLAAVMRLITTIFPQVAGTITAAHVAAITSAFRVIMPGAKVTRIEEPK